MDDICVIPGLLLVHELFMQGLAIILAMAFAVEITVLITLIPIFIFMNRLYITSPQLFQEGNIFSFYFPKENINIIGKYKYLMRSTYKMLLLLFFLYFICPEIQLGFTLLFPLCQQYIRMSTILHVLKYLKNFSFSSLNSNYEEEMTIHCI